MRTQSALAVAALGLGSGVAAYDAPKAGGSGVAYAGVNMAGCDFQCTVEGQCSGGEKAKYLCPKPDKFKSDMNHFMTKWGHNIFRLPVGLVFPAQNLRSMLTNPC